MEVVTTGFVQAPFEFQGSNLKGIVVPRRKSGVGRDLYKQERLQLHKAMMASDADIIHAHWTYEYALAAQTCSKPLLITAHDAPFGILRYMRPVHFWFARALMSLPVLHRSRKLCVISPYLENYFRKVHFYRKPIHVVPEFLPPAAAALFREKEADCQTPVFASVNVGWGPRKNVDTLLRAFHIVRQTLPKAKLLLFGSEYGPCEEAHNYAQSNGCLDGVEFRGATANSDLLPILSKEVDFLVHPSREESFCVSIADAMAMGVPVIGGSKSGAVPWLLENGNCGILVDINKAEEIAKAMLRMVQYPVFARQFRWSAQKRIEEHFRLDQVAARYLELYSKLLSNA